MKQLIRNIQEWLLEDGKCSGCGKELATGIKEKYGDSLYIVCLCKRLYVYDHESKVYAKTEPLCDLTNQKGEFA